MDRFLQYLEEHGGTLTAAEVAGMLNVPLESLDSLAEQQRLVAISRHGETLYPAIQFHAGALLPHLAEILNLLPTSDPVGMYRFLVTYDPELGSNRAEALAAGRQLELIRRRARQFNEQIAW